MQKLLKDIGYFFGKKDSLGFPVRYDEHGKQIVIPAWADYNWTGVKEPITRAEVIAWVKDLRSGKFQQIRSNLCDENGYCCLGVLGRNELVPMSANRLDSLRYRFGEGGKYYGSGSVLSFDEEISEEDYGRVHYVKLPEQLQRKYYRMNDNSRKTFAQIADEIEKDFGLV